MTAGAVVDTPSTVVGAPSTTVEAPAAKRVKTGTENKHHYHVTVRPFNAVRPRLPEHAKLAASVPYDVINTEEARKLREGNDLSFLRVVRPEVDMEVGVDEYSAEVYEKGAENLQKFLEDGVFKEDKTESVYLYKLRMGDHEQVGIACTVSVDDYDQDKIAKHEHTRPVKENDRVRHIMKVKAHCEPIMLVYHHQEKIDQMVDEIIKTTKPKYDFVSDDGVHHTLWRVKKPDALVEEFKAVKRMYIADGHHRGKAASRLAAAVRGEDDIKLLEEVHEERHKYFPAVVFPANQMKIMPYNRVIYKLPFSQDEFIAKMKAVAGVTITEADLKEPKEIGTCCIYMGGKWYTMTIPPASDPTPSSSLDVARLAEHVLEPLLGIKDSRTDKNIGFVGGIRGVEELERLVNEKKAEVAFSMYSTSIDDLLAVSEAGQLMPPKSTWFEPKLRSGMFVHKL